MAHAGGDAGGFGQSELIRIGPGKFARRGQRTRIRTVLQFGLGNIKFAEIECQAEKSDQNGHRQCHDNSDCAAFFSRARTLSAAAHLDWKSFHRLLVIRWLLYVTQWLLRVASGLLGGCYAVRLSF